MAQEKVSFWAMKKISKPVRVKFVSEGKLISFWATKKEKVPTKVTFHKR